MQLNHYLNFQGETEVAFNFYKSVFGGEFSHFQKYADLTDAQIAEHEKDYVLHVSLPINEFTELMGSDTSEQFCAQNNAPFIKGNNHYISINLDASEQDKAHQFFDALSKNGSVEMPLEKTFWGAIYGAFTDQFGVKWMINCQLEEH